MRNDGNFISWTIPSTCGTNEYTNGIMSSNQVGFAENASLCNSQLIFTVTFANSSSISVTLTIHQPVLLNGTRISCRDQSTTLNILSSKSFF